MSCCAYRCTNRKSKNVPGITFHRFPVNQERRAEWIKAIKRENWLPTPYTRICSTHFKPEFFDRSMKKVVLRENAVPTIFQTFPSHLQNVLSSLKVMDEPLFIKCETNWPSDTEESSNFELNKQLTTENTVKIKVEPDHVLGWTDEEGETEIMKEEHDFEELNEQMTTENTLEIKVEPDCVLGWTDEEGETEIMPEHDFEEEVSSDVSDAREDRAFKSEKDFQSNAAEEKKYKCDICLERFSDKNHLTTHERTHTLIKPFKCDVCGLVVASATSLRLHLIGHTGNYKFKCDICNKGFHNIALFKKHKVTHIRKYEFECQICKKTFFQKSSLDKHMLVHDPVRELPQYRCHLCSFCTHRRASVRTHLIKMHVPSTLNVL